MPGCVVRGSEQLGRRIFSRKAAARAHRGRILPKIFKSGTVLISVDRISAAPLEDVEQAARRASGDRSNSLEGWAVVRCVVVRESGRRVRATPTDANPYHADVVLPLKDSSDRRLLDQHAQDLAKAAKWMPSSSWVPPLAAD